MIKNTLLTAFALLGAVSSATVLNGPTALDGGLPGGIQAFLDLTTLNDALTYLRGTLPVSMLKNHTYPLDIHLVNVLGANVNVDQIHINTCVIGASSLGFIDDQNVRLSISNISLDANLVANVTHVALLGDAHIETLKIDNVALEITFNTSSTDKVHWQLAETTLVSVGNVDIHFSEPKWNFLFKESHDEVIKLINMGTGMLEGAIQGFVDGLNQKLAAESTDYNFFEAPVGDQVINFTMTRYPELDKANNRITFNVDARFYSQVAKKSLGLLNTAEWATLTLESRKVSAFFHADMINSLAYNWVQKFDSPALQGILFSHIPDIRRYYGSSASCEIVHTFPENMNNNPISFSYEQGMDVTKLTTLAMINCASDNTTVKENFIEYTEDLSFNFKGTWDNFVYYGEIANATVDNVDYVWSSKPLGSVGWTGLAFDLVDQAVTEFNAKWQTPVDLKMKYSAIFFLSFACQQTLLTPFTPDFIYAGFNWMSQG